MQAEADEVVWCARRNVDRHKQTRRRGVLGERLKSALDVCVLVLGVGQKVMLAPD